MIRVVLAMSLDGKIADISRQAARFGSKSDQIYLEKQVHLADGVLFGANTLRAYGSCVSVRNPELIMARTQQGKPPQPVQILCSISGNWNPDCLFFRQPVPRWLLTTDSNLGKFGFEKVVVVPFGLLGIDWNIAIARLRELGISDLMVLGGGHLVWSLIHQGLVDELYLTICPLVVGGVSAPTPVEGRGFLIENAPRWKLLSVEQIEDEVFLHYKIT